MIESGAWSAWLDGELSEGERARVEAHLAACPACARQVAVWQAVRRQLAGYAPPPPAPGAVDAFWARLAPELAPAPRRRPDPALYLAPAALALAWVLVQGAGWVWLLGGSLGGTHVLAAAWRWLVASGLLGALTPSWQLAVPPGWAGPLWVLGGSAVVWTATAAVAVLYGAWLAFWLRRPAPVAERMAQG